MSARLKQPDALAATSVQQCGSETVENKISYSTVQDVKGQDKTHLQNVTATKEHTIRPTLPTAVTKTSLRMREKTVEVSQIHEIDEIVRRCCAG